MRLRRIQVPNFRALKSVDLSLDSSFSKQIFPLGSWNGGGKSTLLQLTFALLHCSLKKKRQAHLQTLLEGYSQDFATSTGTLATFDVEVGELSLTLSYLTLGEEFLSEGLALGGRETRGFALHRTRRDLHERAHLLKRDQRSLLNEDKPMSPSVRRRLAERLGPLPGFPVWRYPGPLH